MVHRGIILRFEKCLENFPRRPEVSLEDFLLNRFGRALYETFFKHYTEKVWGVPCTKISAEWGAQHIKGLSVTRALVHALKAPLTSLGLDGGAGKVVSDRPQWHASLQQSGPFHADDALRGGGHPGGLAERSGWAGQQADDLGGEYR